MRLLLLTLRILKGIYDILVSYLLSWILTFAALAWCFHAATALGAALAGFESTEALWRWFDRSIWHNSLTVRLAGFGLLHLIILWRGRRLLRQARTWLERRVDTALERYRRWGKDNPQGRAAAGVTFSVVITALLVPFVVQPTLVPLRIGGDAWARRAANLVDGSASAALVDSSVGLYRKLFAEPVLAEGVTVEEFDSSVGPARPDPAAPAGVRARPSPMMDRWDPLIWNEVGRDREAFARVKAFILVESAGMQYAVSRTGCSGLTQFCLGTARSGGFKKIFGLGQLYPCGCRGACRVPRTMRQALESGDPERISGQGAGFPCDLTDARFNPRKSIAAGWLYIRRLSRSVGGNLYLMYIGYNSGPAVARRIHASLKANKDTDLAEIAPLLPGALRPYFGNKADSRARSLVKIHLPKLRRAYDAYRVAGPRGPR